MESNLNKEKLIKIIKEKLLPFVRKIDEEAFYPEEFLSKVGHSGFFTSSTLDEKKIRIRELELIEETAKVCMTTAFLLWSHLGALASVRLSKNSYIKNELLPLLERGEIFGGTGLSNALKYYAGIEPLRLKAERTDGGFNISGNLPSVSNLRDNHWVVIIASVNDHKRVMCLLPVNIEGLVLERKINFIALNGSATYSCDFHNVFVPDKWIITEEADEFIEQVRPTLAFYQIPLGLGVSNASINKIEKTYELNLAAHKNISPQPKELINDVQYIRNKISEYTKVTDLTAVCKDLLLTRLEVVKLTLKVVHADMLYSAGQAFIEGSDSFRRLREGYFLLNLTPTVKQLEK